MVSNARTNFQENPINHFLNMRRQSKSTDEVQTDRQTDGQAETSISPISFAGYKKWLVVTSQTSLRTKSELKTSL